MHFCCLLTGLHFESEGVLLLDSVCEEEASIAAVVCVSVLGQNIGEVQVSIQTHGHSLILRDWAHSCRRSTGRNEKGEKERKYSHISLNDLHRS